MSHWWFHSEIEGFCRLVLWNLTHRKLKLALFHPPQEKEKKTIWLEAPQYLGWKVWHQHHHYSPMLSWFIATPSQILIFTTKLFQNAWTYFQVLRHFQSLNYNALILEYLYLRTYIVQWELHAQPEVTFYRTRFLPAENRSIPLSCFKNINWISHPDWEALYGPSLIALLFLFSKVKPH